MFCESCGKKLNEGAAFCPFCGQAVTAASMQAAAAAQPGMRMTPQPEKPSGNGFAAGNGMMHAGAGGTMTPRVQANPVYVVQPKKAAGFSFGALVAAVGYLLMLVALTQPIGSVLRVDVPFREVFRALELYLYEDSNGGGPDLMMIVRIALITGLVVSVVAIATRGKALLFLMTLIDAGVIIFAIVKFTSFMENGLKTGDETLNYLSGQLMTHTVEYGMGFYLLLGGVFAAVIGMFMNLGSKS